MLYLLDLDNTIFDTNSFKEYLFGIKGEDKRDFLKTSYENIKRKHGFNNFQERLNSCDMKRDNIQNIKQFVYEDFYRFVEKYNKNKIIIISFGDRIFQEFKIKKSGIDKLVKEYFITDKPDKKETINEIYKKYKEPIIYIDDKVFVKSNNFRFEIKIYKIQRELENGVNSLDYFLNYKQE